jgi:hypothetical protein
MTPSFMSAAAKQLAPRMGGIGLAAFFLLAGGVAIAVAASTVLQAYETVLVFLALPLFGIGIACMGLLLVVQLYLKPLHRPETGLLARLAFWWNHVCRLVGAPLLVLWFVGLFLVMLAVAGLGLLRLLRWLSGSLVAG